MGFHLSNLISYGTGLTQGANTDATADSSQIQLEKGMAALRGMSAGETLQGEVMSVNGNEVEIKIADQATVIAKLEQNLNITVGQKLFFEVSNGANGQISLRALFTNLAQAELAQNALLEAGIDENGQSVQMVSALMKEGMPIDMTTLQDVYRDIVKYPDAEQNLLIHMHKIGMETTPQNVEQFNALLQYEQRITDTMEELIHQIPEELKNWNTEDNSKEAMLITRELITLLSEYEMGGQDASAEQSKAAQTTALQDEATMKDPAFGEVILKDAGEAISEDTILEKPILKDAILEEPILKEAIAEESVDLAKEAPANTVAKENLAALSELLSDAERSEFANALEQSGFSEKLVFAVKDASLPMHDILMLLKSELENKDDLTGSKLWNVPSFQKLMEKGLQKAWLLNPTEIENGKNISDFYNRLNTQVNSILQSMSKSLGENMSLSVNLTQFQENIDFLNQLNQFVPYVQLPLKMNGQSATGDLYVFADKKSLAGSKDTVSAALHLNMKHLGQVDVFVKLQDKNVNTDFYLEDEEVLDFVAAHMDMLSERLERRGYTLHAAAKKKEKPMSLKEDMLPAESTQTLNANIQKAENTIALYRFDVRA